MKGKGAKGAGAYSPGKPRRTGKSSKAPTAPSPSWPAAPERAAFIRADPALVEYRNLAAAALRILRAWRKQARQSRPGTRKFEPLRRRALSVMWEAVRQGRIPDDLGDLIEAITDRLARPRGQAKRQGKGLRPGARGAALEWAMKFKALGDAPARGLWNHLARIGKPVSLRTVRRWLRSDPAFASDFAAAKARRAAMERQRKGPTQAEREAMRAINRAQLLEVVRTAARKKG